ncbi:hypothetical protein QJQ45_019155, partial [Haematococcus lacustris]
ALLMTLSPGHEAIPAPLATPTPSPHSTSTPPAAPTLYTHLAPSTPSTQGPGGLGLFSSFTSAAAGSGGQGAGGEEGAGWAGPGARSAALAAADLVAAREAAVLAALRLINKLWQVLALDARFLADTAASSRGVSRYQPLDQQLQAGGGGGGGGKGGGEGMGQGTSSSSSSSGGEGGGGGGALVTKGAAATATPGSSTGSSLVLLGAASGSQRGVLATLLQYVCYQESQDIQVEAVQLALELSRRLPQLVEVVQGGEVEAGEGPGPSLLALRRGYAVLLRASLFEGGAVDDLDAGPAGDAGSSPPASDPRAALVLRLLLLGCEVGTAPSLTHLLMGYEVGGAPGSLEDSLLLPHQEYSCLTIMQRALVHDGCSLSRAKPKLYSQMLCLLHRLASQPASSVPLLEYLAPKNVDLLPQLRTVLAQALPDSSQPLECSAALHQLSWLLRLQALLLLRLEHQPSMQSLLADLLTDGLAAASSSGSSPAPAALLAPLGRCVLLHTLSSIASVTPTEALLGAIPAEQRRLQSDMTAGDVSIEALLVHPHVQAALGVHMSNDTGDVLFNMAALYPLLMQRYEQYVARSGPGSSSDAAVAAVRSALQYVQQYNAHALVSGAQQCVKAEKSECDRIGHPGVGHPLFALQAAAEAWVQLAEVAFTRCYAQLAPALPDADPLTKLYEVLTYSLQASSQLLATQAAGGQSSSPATSLPPLLVNAARILLSKLQEQAAVSVPLGMAADPLALVRVPTRCHELLRLLLELLARARRSQLVRVQLYAALLQYLQFCRGSKLGGCSPLVLSALMDSLDSGLGPAPLGLGNGSASASHQAGLAPGSRGSTLVARMDAEQEAIEQGNAALINDQGAALAVQPLPPSAAAAAAADHQVELVARDALDASAAQLQQAVALHLLAALVTATCCCPPAPPTPQISHAGMLGAPMAHAQQGAGPSPLATALLQQNVPQVLFQGLAALPDSVLVSPSQSSRRAVTVLQAQLSLLLVMAQSGSGPKARQLAAQSLYSLQPLQYLTGCQGLDLEPEDPSALMTAAGTALQRDSLRSRLQRLLPCALRLVLALMTALPESSSVRQDARLFVGAHYRALDRLLREAASSGTSSWAPGPAELEQAELATCLLLRLVPVWDELGPAQAEGLRHGLYRLAATFCCQDSRGSSPIVRSLHIAAPPGSTSGSNRIALIARASRVASLRVALARYLRNTVAHVLSSSSSSSAAPAKPGQNGHQQQQPSFPAASMVPASASKGFGAWGGSDTQNPRDTGSSGQGAVGGPPGGTGASVPFRLLGGGARPEYDPQTGGPTLMLVRDMAEQGCVDAGAALEELSELLQLLRCPDYQLDEATCAEKLADYAPGSAALAQRGLAALPADDSAGGSAAGGGARGLPACRSLTRHYVALAASQLDGLLGKTLFIVEHALAIIAMHFLRSELHRRTHPSRPTPPSNYLL